MKKTIFTTITNLTYLLYLLFIFCLLFESCDNNPPTEAIHKEAIHINERAIQFNDQGVVFLNEFFTFGGDSILLDSALYYFNEALRIDENCLAARHNIKPVLFALEQYDELLSLWQSDLNLFDEHDYFSQAIAQEEIANVYHVKGDSISEASYLSMVQANYKLALKHNLNSFTVIGYLDYLTRTEGKEIALKELEKYKSVLKTANSHDSHAVDSYDAMKDYIENFDEADKDNTFQLHP